MNSAPDHVRMNDAYAVRSYRSGDEAGVLRLLDTCFKGWPGKQLSVDATQHLRWKMSSYLGLMNDHAVVESEGEIVGFRLSTAQSAVVGGREMLLHQGTDSAVHPEHQSRGLMGRVRAYEMEAMRHSRDLHLMGQSMHPALRTLRAHHESYTFANRIETLRLAAPELHSRATAGRSRECTSFDGKVDALWRAASGEFDFAIARTPGYLNWRYCDCRAGEFSVLVAEEDERMTGYAVLCTRGKKGHIADMLVLPGRDDVLRGLIDDAQEHFGSAGIAQVECWMAERHPYRDALVASGFARRKRHGEFGYLPLRAPRQELAVLDGKDAVIHLMAGDVDWI